MKKPAPKPLNPPCYTVTASNEGSYSHLYVSVMEPRPWSSTDHRQIMEITWQANAESRHDWYGLHVKADFASSDSDIAARFTRAAKLGAKIFSLREFSSDPAWVIAKIETAGFPRAAYDSRVSRYVLESEQIDPALIRYLDDWTRYESGREGCTHSALALSPDDAQEQITRKWGENIAKGSTDGHRFAAWIQAGRPVQEAWRHEPAKYPPLTALLNRSEIAAAA